MHATLSRLASLVNGKCIGDRDVVITGLRPIQEAGAGEITFLAHPRYQAFLSSTQAEAIILPMSSPEYKGLTKPIIKVDNPYLALAKLIDFFYPRALPRAGVHPQAVVGKNPKLGQNVSIQAQAALGDDIELGDGVVVYPGVYIGDGVRIGAHSSIFPQVAIYPGVQIGQRVTIHAGSAIGSDGYGYVFADGCHHKIPQVGRLLIEDDVEIGANVTIDRGALGDTVIGRGTKIDNLVQIAHNVVIGEHSLIVSQTGISGSAQLGRYVALGGQVGVVGHIKVGEGTRVAAKAGISKDIPPHSTIAGMAGIPHRKWKESEVIFRRLPKFRAKIMELEQRLAALEQKAGLFPAAGPEK